MASAHLVVSSSLHRGSFGNGVLEERRRRPVCGGLISLAGGGDGGDRKEVMGTKPGAVSREVSRRARSKVSEAPVVETGRICSTLEIPVTCYQILGVSEKAEKDEIVKAAMELKNMEIEDGYTAEVSVSRQMTAYLWKRHIYVQRINYMPMEVCKIVEGQRYSRRLNERQINALLRVTCQQPYERERHILQALKEGDKLMGVGKLKEAVPFYEKVMKDLVFQRELHGMAALQWSICQDSLSSSLMTTSRPSGLIPRRSSQWYSLLLQCS